MDAPRPPVFWLTRKLYSKVGINTVVVLPAPVPAKKHHMSITIIDNPFFFFQSHQKARYALTPEGNWFECTHYFRITCKMCVTMLPASSYVITDGQFGLSMKRKVTLKCKKQ